MKTDIFEAAAQAYTEYLAEHGGYIHCEPIKAMSEIDDEYVYLANNSGFLCMYEIATGKISENS